MEEFQLPKIPDDFIPPPIIKESFYYKNYPVLYETLKKLEDEIILNKWDSELKIPLMILKAKIRQLIK